MRPILLIAFILIFVQLISLSDCHPLPANSQGFRATTKRIYRSVTKNVKSTAIRFGKGAKNLVKQLNEPNSPGYSPHSILGEGKGTYWEHAQHL